MNELIQEIITFIIITGTAFYTMYKTVLFFIPSQNKSACPGCLGGNCGIKQDKYIKPGLALELQKKNY
jgi:hypothetical protein